MHTLMILLAGFMMLGVCVFVSHWLGNPVTAGAKIFIPLWFVAAGINLGIGVTQAGYTVAEELPIFLVVFLVPAAVAGFLWWKFSPGE